MEKCRTKHIRHGDFTALAENYVKHRAGYSETVLKEIRGLFKKNAQEIEAVDIGAGTGIWTRMLAAYGCSVIAVEPNEKMREYGVSGNGKFNIQWMKGTAEETRLPENCCDLVTMASSFHWARFDDALREFRRILRRGGWFAALWNTRLIGQNPVLAEIEGNLRKIAPGIKRVSSGRSEFCKNLDSRLSNCGYFGKVRYTEGRHLERMTKERYIGIWQSVNDVRVQAGPKRFREFMDYLKDRLSQADFIDAAYLTRAWLARIKK